MTSLRRVISVYEKDGERLLVEYSLDEISLKQIKEIIEAKENDSDLYQLYSLNESQWLAFSSIIVELKSLDLMKVDLFYECFSE